MAFIEFDTRNHLPHERADAVRETCAAMANMAPDISDGGTLNMSMHVRLLPGVSIASVECSALSVSRSPRQLADGNDDVLLFLNPGGTPAKGAGGSGWVLRQQGEMACTGGPGYLGLNERAGRIDFHGASSGLLLIAFPRESLLPQVADVDRVLHQSLPDTLPLRLLARQAQARASARGLRQARLKAIQADLRVHAWRGDLTLEWVAARHGISPRYVRALFEQEGTAFSGYLL